MNSFAQLSYVSYRADLGSSRLSGGLAKNVGRRKGELLRESTILTFAGSRAGRHAYFGVENKASNFT